MTDTLTILAFLIVGIGFLWGGAEGLVRGGASFALRMGIPTMIVGLTVLGYGTGTPELVVSIEASMLGNGNIALGNVIGSNIANSTLILGLASLLRPIPVKRQFLVHDIPIMILITAILFGVLLFTNHIGRIIGALFLAGILLYSYLTIREGMKDHPLIALEKEEIDHLKLKSHWLEYLLIFLGFIALVFGGNLFLRGSILLAKLLNVSDAMIAVTVVALGTSLPELALTIIAVIRKHGDFVIGNIVGSNIFNILAIVGLAALIQPMMISQITTFDNLFMMGTALVIWLLAWTGQRISRLEGGLFLVLYALFITVQVLMVS